MLDRYRNFTLYLAIDQNVTVPEKCMTFTCRQVEDSPVLSSGTTLKLNLERGATAFVFLLLLRRTNLAFDKKIIFISIMRRKYSVSVFC